MIVLARRLDPLAREIRRFLEDEVDAPTTRAMEKIAQARWKVYGRTVPPDATFTLRLSYGDGEGLPGRGHRRSRRSPPSTASSTARSRTAARRPGTCPPRWLKEKVARSTARTPLNFVSTNDIIGGNSGSPVVDRAGEFVGIVFDGNIQSLAWDYFFTDEQGRCVSVDARGILEALRERLRRRRARARADVR